MAVKTDSEFYEFASTSKQTPSISAELTGYRSKKLIPFYKAKGTLHSGKIIKPKCSSLNWFSKSLIVHLQKPEFLHSHCILKKNKWRTNLADPFAIRDSEMNDVLGNVCYRRKLLDYSNCRFSADQSNMMDESTFSSTDIESDSPIGPISPRFNSPVDRSSSQSSKSQSSIEDLNKEIEKLFLNNTEKYGFSSFVWDREEIAEGRKAPVSDILTSYKAQNRRKKRRSATALGIRNYNESDSSNGISSQDENSGCEEYGRSDLISTLDPPIIVPVPVGKSSMDHLDTLDFNRPFSGSKLHLSEDSAFAPIKSMQRSQSTPPQNIIDMIDDQED